MTDDDRRLQWLFFEASTRRYSRRQLIRRGVALGLSTPAIAWVLAACGSSSSNSSSSSTAGATSQKLPSTPGSTATSAAAATASPAVAGSIPIAGSSPEAIGTMTGTMKSGGTPQNGGDFTVILGATSYTVDLDPHSYYDINTVNFGSAYEMLIQLNGGSDTTYAPMLATQWGPNADHTEWTFHLRDGIKFHDGTACDASAAVKSFQRLINMQRAPAFVLGRFISNADTDITVVDNLTLKFTLNEPNPAFEAAISSDYGPYLVSPTAVEQHKTAKDPYAHNWFVKNVVGTGPYKQVSINPQQIVLERFPDYWRGWQGAHFDRVILRVVEDISTIRSLMEAGTGDVTINSLTPEAVVDLMKNPAVQVAEYPSTDVRWEFMNCGDRLKDPDLRRGLSYAFPYDQVRNGVFQGLIARTGGPLPPTMRGYDPKVFIYDTDLTKAKQLMNGKLPSDTKLTFMIESGDSLGADMGELFQANLQQIGYNLDIQQVEGSADISLFYGAAPASQRPDIFGSFGWWPDYNDAYDFLYPDFDTKSAGGVGSNGGYYSNPRLDQILTQIANGTESQSTFTQVVSEAQNILTEQDPPVIYLGMRKWYSIFKGDVRGFVPNPIYLATLKYYDLFRVTGS